MFWKQGEDFALELELVHGKPRPTEAHRRFQDIDVDRQPDHRPERVPHAVALVVQVLVCVGGSDSDSDGEGGRG